VLFIVKRGTCDSHSDCFKQDLHILQQEGLASGSKAFLLTPILGIIGYSNGYGFLRRSNMHDIDSTRTR